MGMYFQDDFFAAANELPEQDRNDLIAGLVTFYFTDEEPELKGAAKAVFIALKERLVCAKKKAQSGSKGGSKTQANRQANAKQTTKQTLSKPSSKTEANRQANDQANAKQTVKQTTKQTPSTLLKRERESESENIKEATPSGVAKKSSRFSPPAPAEVSAYAQERGEPYFDSQRFCDYYAAQGWRLSNGNAMKDWRAAVRNWLARDKPKEVEDEFSQYR